MTNLKNTKSLKNRKANKHKILVHLQLIGFIIFFGLYFISCEKDIADGSEKEKQVLSDKTTSRYLQLYDTKKEFPIDEWEYSGKNFRLYEITSDTKISYIQNNIKYAVKYQALIIDSERFLIEIIYEKNEKEVGSFKNLDLLSGYINIIQISSSKQVYSASYKEGKIEYYKGLSIFNVGQTILRNEPPCNVVFGGFDDFGVPLPGWTNTPIPGVNYITVTVVTEHYTDWYQKDIDGNLIPLDTSFDGVSVETFYYPAPAECGELPGGDADPIYRQITEKGILDKPTTPKQLRDLVLILKDHCDSTLTAEMLGHETVSRLKNKTMVEVETTIKNTDYYQIDHLMTTLIDNNYSFPCNPEMSTADMLSQVLNTMGDCSYDNFIQAWRDVDKIVPSQAFEDCDFYNCFYNKLKEEGGEFWCTHLDQIYSTSPEVNTLYLDIYEVQENGLGAPNGAVQFDSGSSHITWMRFRDTGCNPIDKLDAASTFLHESIHAGWKLEIIKLGLESNDEEEKLRLWKKYVHEEYGIEMSEHETMAKEFAKIIATELWELNGKELTIEHYMYYVYEGLEEEFENLFSQDDITNWLDLNNILNAKGNYENQKNYNTYSCE